MGEAVLGGQAPTVSRTPAGSPHLPCGAWTWVLTSPIGQSSGTSGQPLLPQLGLAEDRWPCSAHPPICPAASQTPPRALGGVSPQPAPPAGRSPRSPPAPPRSRLSTKDAGPALPGAFLSPRLSQNRAPGSPPSLQDLGEAWPGAGYTPAAPTAPPCPSPSPGC